MNMTTKNNIFERYKEEYWAASKPRKGEILDHVVDVVGMHRKAVVRKFRTLQRTRSIAPESRGRPLYYTPDVTAALKEVWNAASEPCGENLYPLIAEYVQILKRDNMWPHSSEATAKLLEMSEGTLKTRIGAFARQLRSFGGRGTTSTGAILSMIPIRMDGWDRAHVGTMQLDTVAHCGDSAAGDFIYTVNATDVATLWGAHRAQWNKGQYETLKSMQVIENKLPFSVIQWHPDSGSEFINWHCYDHYAGRMTRSRPYRKNDNCFVEERNGHVVRKWIGYTRFDVIDVVDALNDVYDTLTQYLNHFVASKRIVKKQRIGATWKIIREKQAKTPYQRVLHSDDTSRELKRMLKKEHETLNPLVLKEVVVKKIKIVLNTQKRHSIL